MHLNLGAKLINLSAVLECRSMVIRMIYISRQFLKAAGWKIFFTENCQKKAYISSYFQTLFKISHILKAKNIFGGKPIIELMSWAEFRYKYGSLNFCLWKCLVVIFFWLSCILTISVDKFSHKQYCCPYIAFSNWWGAAI